jgi:hypothetical protein
MLDVRITSIINPKEFTSVRNLASSEEEEEKTQHV